MTSVHYERFFFFGNSIENVLNITLTLNSFIPTPATQDGRRKYRKDKWEMWEEIMTERSGGVNGRKMGWV